MQQFIMLQTKSAPMIFLCNYLMVKVVDLYLEDVLFGQLDTKIERKTVFGFLVLLNFNW